MMGDYTEHLISMAGGDGDDASGMAGFLAAHFDLQWSFEYGGFVCVECGWQETYARPYAKDAEACARASHLESVLTAAGFGKLS